MRINRELIVHNVLEIGKNFWTVSIEFVVGHLYRCKDFDLTVARDLGCESRCQVDVFEPPGRVKKMIGMKRAEKMKKTRSIYLSLNSPVPYLFFSLPKMNSRESRFPPTTRTNPVIHQPRSPDPMNEFSSKNI